MNGQNKITLTPEQADRLNQYFINRNDSLNLYGGMPETNIPEENLSFEESGEKSWLSNKVDEWLPNIVKKAYNESIQGMGKELITGEKRFNLDGYDPGVKGDIGATVLSFFMPVDLITTIAGGGVGGLAAKAGAKNALGRAVTMGSKKLMQAGIKKETAREVIEAGSKKILDEAGTQAGAAFTYSGLQSALSQKMKDERVDWSEVLTDASRNSLVAGLGGSVLGRAKGRGQGKLAGYTQEAFTIGTLDPVLRGESPTVEGYIQSVGFAMGLTGAAGTARSLRKYKENLNKVYLLDEQSKINPISKLSVEDRAKQAEVAREFTEAKWQSERGAKLWSKKTGSETVRIIKSGEDKKGKFYRVIDNETQKQKKIYKNTFFRNYQEENLSRIKTQKSIASIAKNLGINPETEAFILLGKATSLLSDRELLNYNQKLFNKYINRDFRREFADYSDSIPQQDLLDSWLGTSIANLIKTAPKTFKDRGSQAIVKTFYQIADNVSLFEAKSRKEVIKLRELLGTNENELRQVFLEATGRKKATKKNAAKLQEIKKIFDDRLEYAKRGNIAAAGKISKFLPQYFRHDIKDLLFDDYIKVEKATALMYKSGELQKFEKDLIQTIVLDKMANNKLSAPFRELMDDIIRQEQQRTGKKMSYAEAYALFREDALPSKVNPHGSIENPRKFEIPTNLLETDPVKLLAIYDSRLGRRVETARVWGNNNQFITKAISNIKSSDEQIRLRGMVDKMTGYSNVEAFQKMNPNLRKFVDNVMAFEAITKISLGDATIKNVGQTLISTMPMLGMMRTGKAFIKITTDKEFRDSLPYVYQDFIREMVGSVGSSGGKFDMLGAAQIASKLGFEQANKFNALLSAATAKLAIDDYIKMYKKNPDGVKGRYAKEKLKSFFSLDVDKIDSLDNNKIQGAISAFSKRSQVQRDFLREQDWLSKPEVRPFVLFKSFGLKQAQLMTESIKEELRLGNPMIVARMAIGGYAGSQLVGAGLDLISRVTSGRWNYDDKDPIPNQIAEGIATIGAFGMLSDFMAAEDKFNALSFAVKPVLYDDLVRAVGSFQELTKSFDEFGYNSIAVRRATHKASRIFGSNARRLSERFIATEAQKRQRTQGEKQRVVDKMHRFMMAGNQKLVIENLKRWNNLNPSNPISMNDVNYETIATAALRKNMKINTEDLTPEELEIYKRIMRR
tara:strand:- start:7104 stop:10667 length:3564 start_codon:yes stop_codon:yes gene_type:complete